MTQAVLNDVAANVGYAHGVSAWFQLDFTGDYLELGDLIAAGVNLAPEFSEFNTYRNGLRALGKRVLTKKAGTIQLTLNEPNILNFQRVLYGGAVKVPGDADSLDSATIYDGRLMELEAGTGSTLVVDFTDVSESDFANITVKGVYATTDPNFSDNLLAGDVTLNAVTGKSLSLGTTPLGGTGGPVALDQVYVRYEIAMDNAYSTEIFGAANVEIIGASQLQVRNQSGGVLQLWQLASVQLSANGDIAYPIDGPQTIPLTMTMLERNGTFGRLFTK